MIKKLLEMVQVTVPYYHISDMIPVALPPRVASDGLQDPCPYFV